jgi:threonine/homoserine/homoserine lactone efflux protein
VKRVDEMTLWGIFISALIIGFSGAMMPGPMFGVTIDGSIRKGYLAGPLIVLGHGILELTLVIVMAFGLKGFFSNSIVAGVIGLFGGSFLGWMGYGMVKSSIQKKVSLNNRGDGNIKGKSLVLTGIVVSATNPYFFIWWASTGAESIRQAYALGLIGVLFFFTGHILSDLTWYSVVSIAFSRGRKFINDSVYRWIILCLGLFMLVFSIYFISGGLRMLFSTA